MPLTEKTFPIRMSNETYQRLETQAKRFGLSVTSYIRQTLITHLEIDEAFPQPKREKK